LLPRNCSKHALRFRYIVYHLFCGRFGNQDFIDEPALGFPSILNPIGNVATQIRYRFG
jgi:hypothetical protein